MDGSKGSKNGADEMRIDGMESSEDGWIAGKR